MTSDPPSQAPALARLFGSLTAERAALLLCVVAGLVPIWSVARFPSTDGPMHLYVVYIMEQLAQPGTNVFDRIFQFNPNLEPNYAVYGIIWLLSQLVPMLTAEKLFVSGYWLLFAGSAYYLMRSRALDPTARTAIVSRALVGLSDPFTSRCWTALPTPRPSVGASSASAPITTARNASNNVNGPTTRWINAGQLSTALDMAGFTAGIAAAVQLLSSRLSGPPEAGHGDAVQGCCLAQSRPASGNLAQVHLGRCQHDRRRQQARRPPPNEPGAWLNFQWRHSARPWND